MKLQPGQTGQFAVLFLNAGTATWQRGDVVLAACCPVGTTTLGAWNSGWYSPTIYAAQSNTGGVAPGKNGSFVFNVKVPAGQAAGTYTFEARLIVASTGAQLNGRVWFVVTVP